MEYIAIFSALFGSIFALCLVISLGVYILFHCPEKISLAIVRRYPTLSKHRTSLDLIITLLLISLIASSLLTVGFAFSV